MSFPKTTVTITRPTAISSSSSSSSSSSNNHSNRPPTRRRQQPERSRHRQSFSFVQRGLVRLVLLVGVVITTGLTLLVPKPTEASFFWRSRGRRGDPQQQEGKDSNADEQEQRDRYYYQDPTRTSGDDRSTKEDTSDSYTVMEASDDPYDILGVPVQASETEIRSAYRKLALKHHPDKQRTEEQRQQATVTFAKISNAYELLSDPQQRQEYDIQKQRGGTFGADAGGGFHRHPNMDDFFAQFHRNAHHHFHDPFEVFERVFRQEFGHGGHHQPHGGGGMMGGGFPGFGGSLFDDPFFGRSPFGGGFGGGGGMMDDPFFSDPFGSMFGGGGRRQQPQQQQQQQQQQIQHRDSRQQRAYRDPFSDMFDSMRQMQEQAAGRGGGNNGNSYTFTSTTTTSYGGPNGESVTTTTRNINGEQVTERVTTKADGTVHREILESSGGSGTRRLENGNRPRNGALPPPPTPDEAARPSPSSSKRKSRNHHHHHAGGNDDPNSDGGNGGGGGFFSSFTRRNSNPDTGGNKQRRRHSHRRGGDDEEDGR